MIPTLVRSTLASMVARSSAFTPDLPRSAWQQKMADLPPLRSRGHSRVCTCCAGMLEYGDATQL